MPTKMDMPAKPSAKQIKYNEHATKINNMRVDGLNELLEPKNLNGAQVAALLRFLRHRLPYDMLASLEENLKFQLGDNDSIHINAGSLARYLMVLPCKKIRVSPISFDNDTGKIAIWYNSDRTEHDSVKITLIANEYDFTFAVLSRRDSLATMNGSLSLRPDAHYKIEAFMDTTLELAIDSESDDAGM